MSQRNTEYETCYTVVQAPSLKTLTDGVNEHLKRGYRPLGGPSQTTSKDPKASGLKQSFFQAMLYDNPKDMREYLSKKH